MKGEDGASPDDAPATVSSSDASRSHTPERFVEAKEDVEEVVPNGGAAKSDAHEQLPQGSSRSTEKEPCSESEKPTSLTLDTSNIERAKQPVDTIEGSTERKDAYTSGAKPYVQQGVKQDDSQSIEAGQESTTTKDEPLTSASDVPDTQDSATSPRLEHKRTASGRQITPVQAKPSVSEWSHQQLAPPVDEGEHEEQEEEEVWQDMPAFAKHDIYDDETGKIVAHELIEDVEALGYGNIGGASRGYTRVQVDEDAQSATSMDENTAYLFKENVGPSNGIYEDEEDVRDAVAQLQATKDLLTEGQRVAYVGVVRLTLVNMLGELQDMEKTRGSKKEIEFAIEAIKLWSQKIMVRLYAHMEIDTAEQLMIEQLTVHGVQTGDMTPTLMQNARVKNPGFQEEDGLSKAGDKDTDAVSNAATEAQGSANNSVRDSIESVAPPPYQLDAQDDLQEVTNPQDLPTTRKIDIDVRWTILCDLFLVLIRDSAYDARSRTLLERVGEHLQIPWLDICRFEKRVTDALEMEEEVHQETWDEKSHMEKRRREARKRRLMMMGLATVGGGLVIGLSAGLLAPVIGAGLAAGFTTIGVSGTTTFLAGAGGAALVTTTGVVTGGTIGVRASNRRMGAVKTFEYRPLHHNQRVNLIVTVAGWMNGKIDDVRLPYSTVDPIMGDIYSVLWEPEMLRSMGDTINILATEALTQGLQQILGSTILVALMAAIQLPVVLTKLSYLIDNPWSVSLTRADQAGLILADSLVDRNLGVRPITLVGFSIGCRVIFSALQELAKKGALGLVQNVYLFGSPIVISKDAFLRAKSVVSGRFVNGYATNDWILGYLFRATGGGILPVAGLSAVDIRGIENFDVTDIVPGHMAYRAAMPKLMKHVGWVVESEEFTEIEDPDPDAHEKRQRELIDEIEEARKALEGKPEKRRFGIFGGKKKTEKRAWETYDERSNRGLNGDKPGEGDDLPGGLIFDVDAIRAEAAELAAQGIQIKHLETTLPMMNLNYPYSSNGEAASRSAPTITPPRPFGRQTSPSPSRDMRHSESNERSRSPASHYHLPTVAVQQPYGSSTRDASPASPYEERVSMTFEPQFSSTVREPSPLRQQESREEEEVTMTFDTHYESSFDRPTSITPPRDPSPEPHPRPTLTTSYSTPMPDVRLDRNVWADEDGFGEEEVKMTFE